ncbi:MAG: GntR family transcriptional regulator [Cellulosilyticaceae bacterium]
MKIIISNQSDSPIYEQIKEQIKIAILNGELGEGDALPSIRGLAKDLKVSAITTTKAYSELEAEGFVKNMQGKGCFVLPTNGEMMKETLLRQVEEHLFEAARIAKLAKIGSEKFKEMVTFAIEEEGLDE